MTAVGYGQDIASVAHSIAVQEGWYTKGSLVRRLNNPGALIFTGLKGSKRGSGGYASFQTQERGWQALLSTLAYKIDRTGSLVRVLRSWAAADNYACVVLTRARVSDAAEACKVPYVDSYLPRPSTKD